MLDNSLDYDFDDDDDILRSSFTPSSSSTQLSYREKRLNTSSEEENEKSKRIKVCQNDTVSFTKSHSYESVLNVSFPNKVVHRKFPGPAGLLPDCPDVGKTFSEIISEDKTKQKAELTQSVFCSQQSASIFEDGLWDAMKKDISVKNSSYLTDVFNISWIKKQASSNKLINQKAPFLAAKIHSIDVFGEKVPSVNVTLKDLTGEIHGSIMYELYEKYCQNLNLGSVMVLKQIGVLPAGYEDCCLMITENTLAVIYSLRLKKVTATENSSVNDQEENLLEKTVIENIESNEILNNYNREKNEYENRKNRVNFGNVNKNFNKNVTRQYSNNNNGSIHSKLVTSKFIHPQKNASLRNDSVSRAKITNENSENKLAMPSFTKNNVINTPLNNSISINALPDNDILRHKFNFKQTAGSEKLLNRPNLPNAYVSNVDKKEQIITLSCSQVSVKVDKSEHSEIWKNLFDDIDADSLLGDF